MHFYALHTASFTGSFKFSNKKSYIVDLTHISNAEMPQYLPPDSDNFGWFFLATLWSFLGVLP